MRRASRPADISRLKIHSKIAIAYSIAFLPVLLTQIQSDGSSYSFVNILFELAFIASPIIVTSTIIPRELSRSNLKPLYVLGAKYTSATFLIDALMVVNGDATIAMFLVPLAALGILLPLASGLSWGLSLLNGTDL